MRLSLDLTFLDVLEDLWLLFSEDFDEFFSLKNVDAFELELFCFVKFNKYLECVPLEVS